MEENIISAPGGRTMFMQKNSFYYNDKGKKTFSMKGLSGVCQINNGSVTIRNGKVVGSSNVNEFLQNNPNLQGKNIEELKQIYFSAIDDGCYLLLEDSIVKLFWKRTPWVNEDASRANEIPVVN